MRRTAHREIREAVLGKTLDIPPYGSLIRELHQLGFHTIIVKKEINKLGQKDDSGGEG